MAIVLPVELALIDMTGKLDPKLVTACAEALNIQVTRDLPKYWQVNATVKAYPRGQRPRTDWAVQLVAHLPPGEGGFHLDTVTGQPYSKVIAAPGDDSWTLDASHEALEMLVDPYGNRMQSGVAITVDANGDQVDGKDNVDYLMELCDPVEDQNYAYQINGILVSDFLTPHFWDAKAVAGTHYSFGNNLRGPRRLDPGGYISWMDAATGQWSQMLWLDPTQPPQIVSLGAATSNHNFRGWIDGLIAQRQP